MTKRLRSESVRDAVSMFNAVMAGSARGKKQAAKAIKAFNDYIKDIGDGEAR